MGGTKTFELTEKMYKSLMKRGMKLICQCGSGKCGCLLIIGDTIVSKPSRTGRRYYLLEHYEKMIVDLNGKKT